MEFLVTFKNLVISITGDFDVLIDKSFMEWQLNSFELCRMLGTFHDVIEPFGLLLVVTANVIHIALISQGVQIVKQQIEVLVKSWLGFGQKTHRYFSWKMVLGKLSQRNELLFFDMFYKRLAVTKELIWVSVFDVRI